MHVNQQRGDVTRVVINSGRFGHRFLYTSALLATRNWHARHVRGRGWWMHVARVHLSSDSRRLSRAASHAPARGLRVLTPIQQRAEKEKRSRDARDRFFTSSRAGSVPRERWTKEPNVLLPSAGVLTTNAFGFSIVRSTVESVEDCRDAKGRSGAGGRDGR